MRKTARVTCSSVGSSICAIVCVRNARGTGIACPQQYSKRDRSSTTHRRHFLELTVVERLQVGKAGVVLEEAEVD